MNFSFTLIELSVALSVIGILSAVGISAYKSSNPELKQDLKKMKAIEDKLQEFFNVNGRLPFPANAENGISHTNYLLEIPTSVAQEPVCVDEVVYCTSGDCCVSEDTYFNKRYYIDGGTPFLSCYGGLITEFEVSRFTQRTQQTCSGGSNQTNILWGIVPTRTLGLPDDYAYDSQGHNFEYITNAYIATPNGTETQSGYKKSNYITSNDGKYQVLLTATNNTSPNKAITLTGLSIYNNKTNKQIQTTADNTAYVIMSKGKTNKCFFNTRTSTSVNQEQPTGNLLKNCISNYSESSNAEITIYQGYSKDFDNIVKYRTMNEIIYAKANTAEAKNELTQGRIISYQPRDDPALQTESKNVIEAINELFNKIYPVGSVYISVNSTNPSNIFGGTWVQITDRFLLASTTSKTTGGSNTATLTGLSLSRTKDVAVTVNKHTLTVNEIPSHSHLMVAHGNRYGRDGTNPGSNFYSSSGDVGYGVTTQKYTENTGGNQGHDHTTTITQPEFEISETANIKIEPPYLLFMFGIELHKKISCK